jgi:hypothetical protein
MTLQELYFISKQAKNYEYFKALVCQKEFNVPVTVLVNESDIKLSLTMNTLTDEELDLISKRYVNSIGYNEDDNWATFAILKMAHKEGLQDMRKLLIKE